jgi:hypothetical protein
MANTLKNPITSDKTRTNRDIKAQTIDNGGGITGSIITDIIVSLIPNPFGTKMMTMPIITETINASMKIGMVAHGIGTRLLQVNQNPAPNITHPSD